MILWTGDNRAQWDGSESVDEQTRISANVQVHDGKKTYNAWRFWIKQGDGKIQNGVRAELTRDDHRPSGTERFTAFSVLFPRGFFATEPGAWQVFHQYHQSYKDGRTIGQSPPVEFAVEGDTIKLKTNHWSPPYAERTLWSAPIEYNRWYDFILHAKWSPSPSIGFLELYLDGQKVLPQTPAMTMFPGYDVYLKAGLYRKDTIVPDSILYQANYKEATTLEDVMIPKTAPGVPIPSAPPTPPDVAPEDIGWRVGRKLGTTIYRDGVYTATMVTGQTAETKAMAQRIVDALNAAKI